MPQAMLGHHAYKPFPFFPLLLGGIRKGKISDRAADSRHKPLQNKLSFIVRNHVFFLSVSAFDWCQVPENINKSGVAGAIVHTAWWLTIKKYCMY